LDEHDVAGIPLFPEISRDGDGILVKDVGRGMGAEAMLLREVKTDDGLRGAFGEGLKWASICALRLGCEMRVLSKYVEIFPAVHRTRFGREKKELDLIVFLWREVEDDEPGTRIYVTGYDDRIYKDRFFPFLKDIREVYSQDIKVGEFGRKDSVILPNSPHFGNRLYARDIYVREMDDMSRSRFSYNFWELRLDPDRVQVTSSGEVDSSVSRIWCGCDNVHLVEELLRAMDVKEWEDSVSWRCYTYSIKHPEVWMQAWKNVFGDQTVLETSDLDRAWASNAGYSVKQFPTSFTRIIERHVPTDKTIKAKFADDFKAEAKRLCDTDLDSVSAGNLAVLRWLLGLLPRYCSPEFMPKKRWEQVELCAAEIPVIDGKKLDACFEGDKIYIDVDALEDLFRALYALSHELSHAAGSYDGTIGQVIKNERLSIAMYKTLIMHRNDDIWDRITTSVSETYQN
jgi:hypothetical protein